MWSGGCTDAGGVRGQVATMWSGGCTDAGGVQGQVTPMWSGGCTDIDVSLKFLHVMCILYTVLW